MPRFAANLSMLYTEQPFLDRFQAAAKDGFEAVEYLFPYDFAPEVLAQQLQAHGLSQVFSMRRLGTGTVVSAVWRVCRGGSPSFAVALKRH